MDDHRPIESTRFACSRFGEDTQVDIYDMRKPNPDGRVLPANFARVMQCRNEDNCGIATKHLDGTSSYAWHLCPAHDVFLEKGTFIH